MSPCGKVFREAASSSLSGGADSRLAFGSRKHETLPVQFCSQEARAGVLNEVLEEGRGEQPLEEAREAARALRLIRAGVEEEGARLLRQLKARALPPPHLLRERGLLALEERGVVVVGERRESDDAVNAREELRAEVARELFGKRVAASAGGLGFGGAAADGAMARLRAGGDVA